MVTNQAVKEFVKHLGENTAYFSLLSLLSKYIFVVVLPRKAQWNLTDDLHFLQFFTILALRIHICITPNAWSAWLIHPPIVDVIQTVPEYSY
ncbi:MAG: hypothetical protein QXP20_04305 [Candidatus Bathyarchaeia archaeon]